MVLSSTSALTGTVARITTAATSQKIPHRSCLICLLLAGRTAPRLCHDSDPMWPAGSQQPLPEMGSVLIKFGGLGIYCCAAEIRHKTLQRPKELAHARQRT